MSTLTPILTNGSGEATARDAVAALATPREGAAPWTRVLLRLRETTGKSAVDAWLTKLHIARAAPGVGGSLAVDLAAPDGQVAEFAEAHYAQAIAAALSAEFGAPVEVRFVVTAATADASRAGVAPVQPPLWSDDAAPSPQTPDWPDLAPRLTFDRFVVGAANELAAAAAQAVAGDLGRTYNPLLVHGGVGLGKTHLLHAIGHLVRARQPHVRVRYVAAETYIDDTYTAWRSRDAGVRGDVRAHYRDHVDVLLVDDIQFLQGNDKIQEEFFHLFNAIYQAGKQIVLSSDRFPSELKSLHDRLRSRFEWGLVAELAPPDRDLRVAILLRKADELGIALPHDVVLYLADHLRNNVRELEGALNKLSAHARVGRRPIDLSLARSVLGPVIEVPGRNLTAEVIQRVTAQHFGIKVTDLKGAKRHQAVVVPRMIAMSLIRKHTSASLPEIGRLFGGRDHTTVLHACHRMKGDIAHRSDIQAAVQAIETALGK